MYQTQNKIIDLGWDNFLEDLPKFEYVESDPDLINNLINEFERFTEMDNSTKKKAIDYIKLIENNTELDEKQKHLVYWHVKDVENTFGEFRNEAVKEYLKGFISEKSWQV